MELCEHKRLKHGYEKTYDVTWCLDCGVITHASDGLIGPGLHKRTDWSNWINVNLAAWSCRNEAHDGKRCAQWCGGSSCTAAINERCGQSTGKEPDNPLCHSARKASAGCVEAPSLTLMECAKCGITGLVRADHAEAAIAALERDLTQAVQMYTDAAGERDKALADLAAAQVEIEQWRFAAASAAPEPVPGDRMPDGFGSEPARDAENLAFELWYATHAFDYERHPIGSRECALQRAAWIARSTRGTAPPADERVAALEAQVAGNAKLIARLTETAAEAEAELAKVRVELANWKSGGSQGTIAKWRQDSQELARVKAENEQWKNTVRDIGHTVNCLYSTFPDANKHIVSAIQVVKAERDAAVADAERYR